MKKHEYPATTSKDTRIAMVAKLAAVGISVKPEVMHDFTPEEKARVQELIDEARREGLERMKRS